MNDAQILAKATIAAALIQSRGVDPEGLASQNKDISNHKLARLRELTDRIYQALSDGNRRWEFTLAPRYGVARTEHVNLDLGGVVSQLRTRTNFDNGYYDPSLYQFYGFAAYPYFKIRENVGLGLSLGLGVQRDDFSPTFRLGSSATAEATIGIYKPWALKVSGGGISNQRLGSGAFGGYSAAVSVIRRF